jgi:hypothetical protein
MALICRKLDVSPRFHPVPGYTIAFKKTHTQSVFAICRALIPLTSPISEQFRPIQANINAEDKKQSIRVLALRIALISQQPKVFCGLRHINIASGTICQHSP